MRVTIEVPDIATEKSAKALMKNLQKASRHFPFRIGRNRYSYFLVEEVDESKKDSAIPGTIFWVLCEGPGSTDPLTYHSIDFTPDGTALLTKNHDEKEQLSWTDAVSFILSHVAEVAFNGRTYDTTVPDLTRVLRYLSTIKPKPRKIKIQTTK